MNIGLVARGDKTGLAIQSWGFWRHIKPSKTLVVDLRRFNPRVHECDPNRYEGHGEVLVWDAPYFLKVASEPEDILDGFLDGLDCVFCVETPYNYWLFERARERGVRTVLQPNYEFFDYSGGRDDIARPDVFALPTNWHEADYRMALPGADIIVLPVPVDRDLLPFKARTQLQRILHTAGTVAQPDRNGSEIFIEAMRRVKSPVTARICHQGPLATHDIPKNIEVDTSAPADYWDIYGDEDLYVMPRRWGGLCLPLNEALGCGMPVMMPDVSPQRQWLPLDMLVDTSPDGELATRVPIEKNAVHPTDLAHRLDYLYDNPEQIELLSLWADIWASRNSWDALKGTYEAVLRG